ncbi:MAG: rhamnogalacturonan lyase, partial [Bacteroidaceae bacterium]|nr:rhamnogalacturonan lyase [Bacteroidaceae bacterium]
MKKLNLFFLSVLALCSVSIPAEGREKPSPADTPLSQQEKLDRGFIRVQTGAVSAFLSWRLQATDDEHTSFVVLKNEVPVNTAPLRNTTSYRPTLVKPTDVIKLVTLQNGEPVDTIEPKLFNAATHHVIQLQLPKGGSVGTGSELNEYTYTPNDCSVGDVDGDGEYELIVKWYPTNAKDNSQGGYTGYIMFDCYKIFTGERLWRIQLGRNIRAGAHYNQFLVYDFDGDGKAELICKTAPGSRDGKGNYVSEAATLDAIKNVNNGTDYRVSGGRINGGHEYLTVFNGETGAAIHTIPYLPNRNAEYELSDAKGTFNWYMSSSKSDTGSYGNRGERYLAGVAFLDGPDKNPSAVMCRGMYTRSYLWAVDFDGEKLSTKWVHASLEDNTVQLTDGEGNTTTKKYTKQTGGADSHARYNAYGQGAHSLT